MISNRSETKQKLITVLLRVVKIRIKVKIEKKKANQLNSNKQMVGPIKNITEKIQ